jgi:hypothetical protein
LSGIMGVGFDPATGFVQLVVNHPETTKP